jgi:hypothetical protein
LPLLKEEIIGEGNFGADYAKLSFRNGSLLDIMTPLNSTRGNRATAGILDEFRQFLIVDAEKVEFYFKKIYLISGGEMNDWIHISNYK